MAQITNPNWAPRFPWALLHGEQNTKSFRKKTTKHFPGLLSSCYNVLELLVLASFTHEYKTTVSGMTVPEKESEGLI